MGTVKHYRWPANRFKVMLVADGPPVDSIRPVSPEPVKLTGKFPELFRSPTGTRGKV